MKQAIFRVLALLIGIGAFLVILFPTENQSLSYFGVVGNLFIAVLFLTYAAGGNKLLSSLPVFKEFVKTSGPSNT